MSKDNNRQFIGSLQGMRAFAFLGVYLSHTGLYLFQGCGACAVSLFLVLSGFLCAYTKYTPIKGHELPIGVKSHIAYAVASIKKLYALHVLATFVAIPLLFVGEGTSTIKQTLVALFLNVFLIQEWFPLSLRSINGVSWYLCIVFLFYLFTPTLVRLMRKYFTPKRVIVLLIGCFVFQLMIGVFAGRIPYGVLNNELLEEDLTHWIVYQFPLVRLIDCFEGMCAGYLFISFRTKISRKATYAIEALCLFMLFLSNAVFIIVADNTCEPANRPGRWYIYVLIFTVVSCIFVCAIATEKGFVSLLFRTRLFMYLGKISSYAFVVHMVIIRYVSGIATILKLPIMLTYVLELTLCFLLTLICSQLWIYINSKKRILAKNT